MNLNDLFKKDKALNITIAVLLSVSLLCIFYVFFSYVGRKFKEGTLGNMDCVKEKINLSIDDDFMADIFKKGQTTSFFPNYYNCNPVKSDDLVVYKFADQIPAVVRWVRGVPGDKYNLAEDPKKKGQWTISINGSQIMAGKAPYHIESTSVPPLKTYELSRNGILLDDEYILLANKSPSISDSSNLGLVRKKDIIGKVAQE